MALQNQVVSFPFSGVSEKESPVLLDPGELLTLRNGFFQRAGEIRKRYGYLQKYSTLATSRGNARAISPYGHAGNSLAWSSERAIGQVSSRTATAPDAGNFDFYQSSRATLHRLRIVDSPQPALASGALAAPGGVDVAYDSTNSVAFLAAAGGLYTHDTLTGARGSRDVNAGLTGSVKVVVTAGYVVKIGLDPFGDLRAQGFSRTSSWTFLNAMIASDIDATGYFDVRASSTTSNGINVAYRKQGTGGIVLLQFSGATGAITIGPITDASEDVTKAMSFLEWDESNGSLYLATASASGVRTRAINAATLAISAPVAIDASATGVRNVTGIRVGTTNTVIYDHYDGSAWALYRNGGVAATQSSANECTLISRAFLTTSKSGASLAGVWVTNYGSELQGCVALIEVELTGTTWAELTAMAMYGRHPATSQPCQLSSVVSMGSNQYLVGFLVKTSSAGESTSGGVGTVFGFLTLAPSDIGSPEGFGGTLTLPGTPGFVFDGSAAQPFPSRLPPETPALVSQGVGGSLTGGSSYQFVAVFTRRDLSGRLWRSAPSAPLTVALTAGNGTCTVRVRTTAIGSYLDKSKTGDGEFPYVVVELYRTEGNKTTLYKEAEAIGVGYVNGSHGYVTFVVSSSDDTIDGNEQIYSTAGSELPNYPGQGFVALKSWKGRLFGISAEDPTRVYYTKELRDGYGCEWVGVFTFQVADEEGDFTAIGEMDDKLILFKRSAVYVLTGDGPDLAGNGLYQNPERITVRAGCVNPVAISKCPLGLIYSSPKGIQLLTRGLESQYIGGPVETTWSGLTITGAVCVDDQNQVRFMSSEGTALVYDWVVGAWATFTNQASVACCIWQNKVTWLSNVAGTVQQETPGAWSDNGTAITTSIVTGWLSFANMATFKRVRGVRLVGQRMSAHSVIPKIAYDVVDTDTTYPTIADVATGPYQRDVWLARQKLGSIRVTFTDSLASPGEGARWHGLAFIVAMKRSLARTAG